MARATVFAFDLDGTVTESEILPRIAHELGMFEEMCELTRLALSGGMEFEESFRARFEILKKVPVERVREVVASTPLNRHICNFINTHAKSCAIVTGNLDVWIEPLKKRLGCRFFTSTSSWPGNREVPGEAPEIKHVMRKDEALKELKGGRDVKIVAIGESVNDIPMFQAADTGIAYAGVHDPAPELLRFAHHTVHDGESLCRLLQTLV